MHCRLRLTIPLMCGLAGSVLLLPGRTAAAEKQDQAKADFFQLGDFTVNLPSDSDDDASLTYVVVTLTLEVTPNTAMEVKKVEPLIKEALMRRLMAMADRHILQPNRTDTLVVKSSLLDSVSRIMPGSIQDVLITRLLYG